MNLARYTARMDGSTQYSLSLWPKRNWSRRLIAAAFGIASLCACTPMEWRRGDEVASFDADAYKQCRNRAFLDAMRFAPFPGMYPYPIVGRDRSGRAFVIQPGWSRTDQLMQEHLSMMSCMEQLGFKLVPIPGATHSAAHSSVTPPDSAGSNKTILP
ncbi:MAG: hypothetical protein ACKVQK_00975 [Burkholderiales bacterium]